MRARWLLAIGIGVATLTFVVLVVKHDDRTTVSAAGSSVAPPDPFLPTAVGSRRVFASGHQVIVPAPAAYTTSSREAFTAAVSPELPGIGVSPDTPPTQVLYGIFTDTTVGDVPPDNLTAAPKLRFENRPAFIYRYAAIPLMPSGSGTISGGAAPGVKPVPEDIYFVVDASTSQLLEQFEEPAGP